MTEFFKFLLTEFFKFLLKPLQFIRKYDIIS